MGRPESPLPDDGPVARFAAGLRALRQNAGSPTYAELGDRANYSRSALAAATTGRRLPTWELVRAFVEACGADPVRWRSRWEEAAAGGGPGPVVAARPPARPADPATSAGESRNRRLRQLAAIDPVGAQTAVDFAGHMRQLQVWAGKPSLRALHNRAAECGRSLPTSTLSDALAGERLPKWPTVETFVTACGATERLEVWREAWQRIEMAAIAPDPGTGTFSTGRGRRRAGGRRGREVGPEDVTVVVSRAETGRVESGRVAPDWVAPDRVAPSRVAPDWVVPDRAAPHWVAPDRVAPSRAEPRRAGPIPAAPDRAEPDRPVPERPGSVPEAPDRDGPADAGPAAADPSPGTELRSSDPVPVFGDRPGAAVEAVPTCGAEFGPAGPPIDWDHPRYRVMSIEKVFGGQQKLGALRETLRAMSNQAALPLADGERKALAGDPEMPVALGPYWIVRQIGGGGMGTVYLGVEESGRRAAVKVIRPDLAEDQLFRRRFAHEVEAARLVRPQFTAPIRHADTSAPVPWIATAFVDGESLGDRVRRAGPLVGRQVRQFGALTALALQDIHAAGLIHRDLKPSNVVLAVDGPRVIDFGIVAALDASALTWTGERIGTPAFMSPEQARGATVGPSSDVFALGGLLYFAATGAEPFGKGHPAAVMYRVVNERPALKGVSRWLLPLIEHCLEKTTRDRPSLDDVIEAMDWDGIIVPWD